MKHSRVEWRISCENEAHYIRVKYSGLKWSINSKSEAQGEKRGSKLVRMEHCWVDGRAPSQIEVQ